jgi:hypothetical protein
VAIANIGSDNSPNCHVSEEVAVYPPLSRFLSLSLSLSLSDRVKKSGVGYPHETTLKKQKLERETVYRCHPPMIHFHCPIAARMMRSLFSLASRIGPHARNLGLGYRRREERTRIAKTKKRKKKQGQEQNGEKGKTKNCHPFHSVPVRHRSAQKNLSKMEQIKSMSD